MTPYIADSDFELYVGDVLDVLPTLPAESVHCCVTSPPYWGLRDYGTGSWDGGNPDCDHIARPSGGPSMLDGASHRGRSDVGYGDACGKCGASRTDRQLGLEATPDLYVARMVDVFREVRRVLRDDGTLWLNIGDSYATTPAGNTTAKREIGNAVMRQETADALMAGARRNKIVGDLKPKDLVGIPWLLAFALRADGWYLRSDIIWAKPNPMPESVSDRPTKAHEYLFLLTKSPRYFYDADAIREPNSEWSTDALAGRWQRRTRLRDESRGDSGDAAGANYAQMVNPAGRNKRSVWEIATEPYAAAHFATYPQKLVEPCVLAGTSERGCCPVCGAPWERETERGDLVGTDRGGNYKGREDELAGTMTNRNHGTPGLAYENKTTGWRPSCDHDHPPVPCVVLDPFMGSGTTALVARRLGRKAVGVELNDEYAALAGRRLQQLSLLAEDTA